MIDLGHDSFARGMLIALAFLSAYVVAGLALRRILRRPSR